MKEKYMEIKEIIKTMEDFENKVKIFCFEKNEKQNKRLFSCPHMIDYQNLWDRFKEHLNDKLTSSMTGDKNNG